MGKLEPGIWRRENIPRGWGGDSGRLGEDECLICALRWRFVFDRAWIWGLFLFVFLCCGLRTMSVLMLFILLYFRASMLSSPPSFHTLLPCFSA